jgi:hypothetical protein
MTDEMRSATKDGRKRVMKLGIKSPTMYHDKGLKPLVADRKEDEANKTAKSNNPPLPGGTVILVLLFVFLV